MGSMGASSVCVWVGIVCVWCVFERYFGCLWWIIKMMVFAFYNMVCLIKFGCFSVGCDLGFLGLAIVTMWWVCWN